MINDVLIDYIEQILTKYEQKFKDRKYRYKHIFQISKGIGAAINNALKYIPDEYFM